MQLFLNKNDKIHVTTSLIQLMKVLQKFYVTSLLSKTLIGTFKSGTNVRELYATIKINI